jgi:hypothetical protein
MGSTNLPVWLKAAEGPHYDMAVVVSLVLGILPVAHEARTRYSVAIVATNSACFAAAAAVVLAVGLLLRSHRVWVEVEEAGPDVVEGDDTIDAAHLA